MKLLSAIIDAVQLHRPSIRAQVAEDTCDKHQVWLCEECFDFSPLFIDRESSPARK